MVSDIMSQESLKMSKNKCLILKRISFAKTVEIQAEMSIFLVKGGEIMVTLLDVNAIV